MRSNAVRLNPLPPHVAHVGDSDGLAVLICANARVHASPVEYVERMGERGRECPRCLAERTPGGDPPCVPAPEVVA